MTEQIRSAHDLVSFDAHSICLNILRGGKTELLPQEEFLRWLQLVNAYWKFDYSGDPKKPHALLTSGQHSDGFVNCLELLKYPRALTVIAAQLVKLFQTSNEISGAHSVDLISWVFGSPMAGVTLAHEVAKLLGARAGFTEKNPDFGRVEGARRKMQKRFRIEPHERVLLVEELITTLTTTQEQWEIITTEVDGKPQRANFLPALGVFFNRSGETAFGEWPIISVVEQKMTNWPADECPLCKQGSRAIKPKENWSLLTNQG